MGKWSLVRRSGRLLGMLVAAVLFVSAGAGLLMAGQRTTRPAQRIPPKKAPQPQQRKPAPLPPALPAQPAGEVEIISPEQGATLRGTALIRVDYANPMGYVTFRIDDRFAYATTPPFEMRWDTSGAIDGQHVVSVDAYDGSAKYVGSSSINIAIENSIPTPPDGVLVTVRFDEHDMLTRVITARGELSALQADEALPEGFNVLGGELRAEVTTSVMDTFYEGATTLVRSRIRAGTITADGERTSISELGRYGMLQVSRNGLCVPVATATAKPRVGLAEISLALRDFPVVPGDTWESPIGVVCDLYTRRAIFVQGRHVFEGLRWYRGRECAVFTSTFTIPEVPIYSQTQVQQTTQAGVFDTSRLSYQVVLTQGRGGGMRGGGMIGGGRGGVTRGRTGQTRAQVGRVGGTTGGTATGPGAAQRPVAAGALQSARLVDLEGTRRTYITRQTGRVLHTEDTILGRVEFRAASQVAQADTERFTVELTQGGMGGPGGGGGRGGRGMRGGARGGAMGGARGGARTGAARGATRARAAQPGTAAGGAAQAPAGGGARNIPPKLDYGLRLTTDLSLE